MSLKLFKLPAPGGKTDEMYVIEFIVVFTFSIDNTSPYCLHVGWTAPPLLSWYSSAPIDPETGRCLLRAQSNKIHNRGLYNSLYENS